MIYFLTINILHDMMLQIPDVKVVDAQIWNSALFITTTLITIFLGAIVYYARDTARTQKEIVTELHRLALDLQHMRDNGDNMRENVEELKKKVTKIEDKIYDHDKQFATLKVHK